MVPQFRISKRTAPLGHLGLCIVPLAVALSLFVSLSLLALSGVSPLAGFNSLVQGAFGSSWAWEDSLVKAIPLFLCSQGVAIAFRLQIWNIGAEGQFALGAIGATWVALSLPAQPSWILLPLMVLMAALAGGVWGLIPAVLRQWLGTNEIIVTLMMNYVAILLLEYLVYGIWRDPSGFPMTAEFVPAALVGKIGDTSIHWGLAHCLVLGLLCWLFLRFSHWGYELRVCGENVQAARYAGLPYNTLVALVMVLGGALSGWAGFLETSASLGRLQPSIMVGYGYTAIVVAWLARLNPLKIAVASFFLAALRVGCENLQLDLQVPAAFGSIIEGLILLTVLAGGFFQNYRITRERQS
nr:ABC transporter permease [uncultured Desulfobulbus sp.]